MPQSFSGASSYAVREELQQLISDDLLGPWDGPTEQFAPNSSGPGDRYLVGKLGPRHSVKSATEAASTGLDANVGPGADGDDSEVQDQLTPQNAGRMWASSMGLSCCVIAAAERLKVVASWGRYSKAEILDEEGITRSVWSREPVEVPVEVDLREPLPEPIDLKRHNPAATGVALAVEVRPQGDGSRVVELALINRQDERDRSKDRAWLFQTQLAVTAVDGHQAVFAAIDDPLDDTNAYSDDPEEQHLRLLYRDALRHANGRNVAVHAEVRDGEREAHRLETRWLPTYDVPATVALSHDPRLAGLNLSMDDLGSDRLSRDQLAAALSPLAVGYRAWLGEREAEVSKLPASLRPVAEAAIVTARDIADRIAAGIRLLTDPSIARHEEALAAFRFANQAMALQRRHTQLASLREDGMSYAEATAKVEERGKEAASWRPFQLAFVLLNLPALTDPAHPERRADHTATVDLLFFPTGGGKTEAYLGLTAFTFAIRRLQGVMGTGVQARDGRAGVAVLMRYTLRLLTAQQFQRAAALVCAAEALRQDALERGDDRWGVEPFRIGMWVGQSVAPNWYQDAEKQIGDALRSGTAKRANVLQTKRCPWCGAALQLRANMTDDDRRRILLYCSDGEGPDACRFSYLKARGEGLPILTVDEEIHRLLPALVIATVDKMAQLPWQGYAGMLFGRVSQRCERHGYWHPDLGARIECTGKHTRKNDQLPAVGGLEPVTRLRPPDLVIQDELHLISGALGTTVGLFESAVDELCTWVVAGLDGSSVATGPKFVASTATTKRAAQQVRGVFGRGLAVFPPQVLDVTDTFFSRQVPVTQDAPGRRYMGVCAHGVRLKAAEIRISEILLLAGQTLFDTHGRAADPYMTLVGYFNATRELAGMRRFLDDDVATRVRINGRRRVRSTGALSDRLGRTNLLSVQELTSRISSADITDVLKRLENVFDPELDTSARRAAIRAEFAAARKEKRASSLPERADDRVPVDVVLATSMLQVGVDVSRFGLMVVTGQPKNTAEYIQASSRVGRAADRPGLVLTLYAWTRPRDLAHFEDFEHYHATFYRQVEALSVTPYSRRSLDRGAAAAFVAALRHADEANSRNRAAFDVATNSPVAQRITERFLARALHSGGGERGRDYLAERLAVVRERWERAKQSSARLGYQARSEGKQQLVGLLKPAGDGVWTDLTVPMSMRETENEINLLVPGGGLYDPQYGATPWKSQEASSKDGSVDDDLDDRTDGDELGEIA